MATEALAGLTPDTAEAVKLLLAYAQSRGITLAVTSGKRTCAYQDSLYAQGRTAPGPVVTDARGCGSWHVLGRAVDVLIKAGPKDYAGLAAYWKSLGGKWGGDFPGASARLGDVGHFEYHPGLRYASEVCVDPAHCGIDESKNAPRQWPSDGGGGVSDEGGGSNAGWWIVGLATVAAIAAYAAGKKSR
jgi:hypothetical protein